MIEVTSLKEDHLEDAARLVSKNYTRLYEQIPHLPYRYADFNNLLPLMKDIFNASGSGVAAFRKNCLIGFLTGWQMESFRGKKSIYSPEWANAADQENSRLIYEEMYGKIAAEWVADRYVAHYISLFPNDIDARKAWHWMGFGMIAIDAIRGLDSIGSVDIDVHICRAGLQELEQVLVLHDTLWEYMIRSPIFLLSEKRDRSYYSEWLSNPDRPVWLAYLKEKPVAIMRMGPADDDTCTIIIDKKTTSVFSAFTLEEARRGGIASALLDHALKSAKVSGYERCAVSFEPMNLLGSHFWLNYFRPVCFSLFRHIDERVTQTVL